MEDERKYETVKLFGQPWERETFASLTTRKATEAELVWNGFIPIEERKEEA